VDVTVGLTTIEGVPEFPGVHVKLVADPPLPLRVALCPLQIGATGVIAILGVVVTLTETTSETGHFPALVTVNV
jgi:hypothetical protein